MWRGGRAHQRGTRRPRRRLAPATRTAAVVLIELVAQSCSRHSRRKLGAVAPSHCG